VQFLVKKSLIIFIFFCLCFVHFNVIAQQAPLSISAAKITVGVAQADDRWITLTDGSRVYEGVEISYLLASKLQQSTLYNSILLDAAPVSANSIDKADAHRFEDVPKEWLLQVHSTDVVAPMSILITPKVETLIYVSGARSGRVVYGFSPDHENPFNAGRSGSLDNQFISNPMQKQSCVLPDFFNGAFSPTGFGPFASSYGADLDEGFMFQVFGYGLGFKHKSFQVISQIRFLIDNLQNRSHHEMVFKTTGKGSDIFIAGSYQGFSLGVEIQRRQTLLQALKIVLPQIVDDLLLAGLSDSTLAQISAGAASSGLTVLNDSPMQKTFARTINIAADNTARASVQQASVAQCFGKKTSWVENAINGFFLFYAMWKYNHVLDQSLHQAPKMTASAQALKIAMIDSGFDYNDSALRDHVMADSKNQILGFDFISWDPRPSDDNGHGTAAAKLLAQNLKKPFVLIPLKVIGARGETHSSAIYDSFRYAINNKVDAILVPWSAQPQSQGAFDLGLKLAKQAGISVYTVTNHETKKYITRGLGGAHLGLNAQDAAAVEDFAANINCH
jgi:hypothetical protein